MWWSTTAEAAPVEDLPLSCPSVSETHKVFVGYATGPTSAAARRDAQIAAKRGLLADWCEGPATMQCTEAQARSQITEVADRREGGRWSACATAMIPADAVRTVMHDLDEEIASMTAEVAARISHLSDGKEEKALAIEWSAPGGTPLPTIFPREWLQQRLETSLALLDVTVSRDVLPGGTPKLLLSATDEPMAGGYQVAGCFGRVGSTECEGLAQALLLPKSSPPAAARPPRVGPVVVGALGVTGAAAGAGLLAQTWATAQSVYPTLVAEDQQAYWASTLRPRYATGAGLMAAGTAALVSSLAVSLRH